MPYIHMRCTESLTAAQMEAIKDEFGKAISLLPGKSEAHLMVDIADGAHLWLAGKNDEPLAMVEVEILGKSTPDAYQKLTARLTEILGERAGIAPSGVFVKYAEKTYWGHNGANF